MDTPGEQSPSHSVNELFNEYRDLHRRKGR